MTVAERFSVVLQDVADTCRLTDVDDWTPEQRDTVLARLRDAVREELSLAARIRVVASGGFEHDEIPDLMGHCIRCGAKVAAVRQHTSGYCWDFADPILIPVMRRAVRIFRWTRATVTYLRWGVNGTPQPNPPSSPRPFPAPGTTAPKGK